MQKWWIRVFIFPTVNCLMIYGMHCSEVHATESVLSHSRAQPMSGPVQDNSEPGSSSLLFDKVLLRSSSSCLACMGTVRFLWGSLVLIQEKDGAALLIMHYSWWIETHRALCQIFCGKAASSLSAMSLSTSFHKMRHQRNTTGRGSWQKEGIPSENYSPLKTVSRYLKGFQESGSAHALYSPAPQLLAAGCNVSAATLEGNLTAIFSNRQ